VTHTADGISTDMISLLHTVFLLHYSFLLFHTLSQKHSRIIL